MKRLSRKPLADMTRDMYLRISAAVKEGLISCEISMPQDMLEAHLLTPFCQLYSNIAWAGGVG